MKRFLIFAFIGLVSLFAIDMFANTGLADAVKEKIMTASPGDYGTAILATVGAAVIVTKKEEATEAKQPEKSARERLWVIPISEFDELEAKYRKLYIIDISIDADERYQFIARRPTKDLIDALAASKDNINDATELLIKNMLVVHSKYNPDELNDGVVYQHVLRALTSISKQGKQLFTKA